MANLHERDGRRLGCSVRPDAKAWVPAKEEAQSAPVSLSSPFVLLCAAIIQRIGAKHRIKHDSRHLSNLENQLHPERSSSALTDTGDTNPRDEL